MKYKWNSGDTIFVMFIIGVIFLVFIFTFMGIFIFGDHKELQSEDHVYRMKALEILGDQTHTEGNNPKLPNPKESKTPKPKVNKILQKNHE